MAESRRLEIVRGLYEEFPEDVKRLFTDPEVLTPVTERLGAHTTEDFHVRLLGDAVSGFDERREGLDGLTEAWREWTQPFERYEVVPGDILEGDEAVVVDAIQRAYPADSTSAVETHVAAVYRFRGDRVYAIEFHLDRARAHGSAGLAA